MGTPEHEVAEEIHRRQVQGQAAAQLTRPLLSRGWRIAYVGWAAPILPVIGFFFLVVLSIVALIHGVLAIVKGNTSGGLTPGPGCLAWINRGWPALDGCL
ncbi:hypothetical protein WDV90_04500 [Xanthomonas translucens pv. undulosa]